MSSSDQARRKLDDLRRKRVDAAKKEAEARGKQAAAERRASDYRSRAARATSVATANSYMRQAATAEKESLAAGQKIAEWSRVAADISRREADAHKELEQALRREADDAERARKRQAIREEQERKRREEADRRARDSERRRERARMHATVAAVEARMSRQIEQFRAPERERLRILYLTATPDGGLRVDKEVRRVYKGVRASTQRDLVEIRHMPAATSSDLLDGMSGFQPHVVHFSGHADRSGLLLDTDSCNDNAGQDLTATVFARTMGSVDRPPVLVVLNACESEGHLDDLLEVVPMAIGMTEEVGDPDAMSFAARFYTAIADGQTVQSAFNLAVLQMEFDGMDDADLPTLRTRTGFDAGGTPLVLPAE